MVIDLNSMPSYRPYTNVQPFTIRDGATYLLQLEALKDWLRDYVIPAINTEISELVESWEELTTKLMEDWETKMGELIALVNAAVASIEGKVEDAQEAAAAAQAAAELAEMWASQVQAIQDVAVSTLINDEDSLTRAALDSLIGGSVEIQEILNTINNGRLSEDALNAAFMKRDWLSFPTVQAGREATIPEDVNTVIVRGYREDGDAGGAKYRRVEPDSDAFGKFQSADGAWWEVVNINIRPEMFGAFPVTHDVRDIEVAEAAEMSLTWNLMSTFAKRKGKAVFVSEGYWVHDSTLRIKDGVFYKGDTPGDTWRTVNTSNAASWPNEKYSRLKGAVFVAIGTFAKEHTIRHVTASPQNGFGRNTYLSDRPYNNGLDARMDLLDLTNKDANGINQATPRAFSVAAWFEGDDQYRHHVQDLMFLPNCPLPGETFGTGGYGVKNTVVPWANVDVGIYAPSPFGGLFSGVKAVGYYNDRGLLLTGHKHSNHNIGYTENNVFERCQFQSGASIRMTDSYPVKRVTETTITIRWTPSWSINSGTFLFIGSSIWNYRAVQFTDVSYSPDNGGEITFTVVGGTAGIVAGGPDTSHLWTGFGAGFPNTIFYDTEFFDFSHSTGIHDMSPELGSRARPWSASIEVAGGTISNLRFINCPVRTHGPITWLLGAPENIVVENGWCEGRGSRRMTTADTETLPNGGVFISGATPAMLEEVGDNGVGSIMFNGPQNLHAHVNMHPLYKSPSQYAFSGMENSVTGFVRDEYKMFGQRYTSGFRLWGMRGQEIDIRSRKSDNITRRALWAPGDGSTGLGESANGPAILIPDRVAAATDTLTFRNFASGVDNARSLGSPTNRFSTVYAGTGAINTSDEREKEDIREVSQRETAVARKLQRAVRAFRWKDAVREKGSDARIHFGVIAQEVEEVFRSEGLDPWEYGILCYDEWDAIEGEREAGDRYGVRHDELVMFILSSIQ